MDSFAEAKISEKKGLFSIRRTKCTLVKALKVSPPLPFHYKPPHKYEL